ncbi:UBE2D4 isoform 11 [Pan troglodytes]|uniref:Ubiquitin conjugating enzyme E2 D4 n=2 Tax=Homininae TaxID=207598 RepID=F2Z3J6_HUMAN|nr:UBE2D4 isoform 4 [Pan troglodytes]PNI31686.1 UBE2D4 isoform 8 [Pan troglodytes]PNI31688.1 UBE2D4 isoform 10 [Pan troglodytes]PNI31689.1 UBE2D4 isoform 11 [Pan troglodytes]
MALKRIQKAVQEAWCQHLLLVRPQEAYNHGRKQRRSRRVTWN